MLNALQVRGPARSQNPGITGFMSATSDTIVASAEAQPHSSTPKENSCPASTPPKDAAPVLEVHATTATILALEITKVRTLPCALQAKPAPQMAPLLCSSETRLPSDAPAKAKLRLIKITADTDDSEIAKVPCKVLAQNTQSAPQMAPLIWSSETCVPGRFSDATANAKIRVPITAATVDSEIAKMLARHAQTGPQKAPLIQLCETQRPGNFNDVPGKHTPSTLAITPNTLDSMIAEVLAKNTQSTPPMPPVIQSSETRVSGHLNDAPGKPKPRIPQITVVLPKPSRFSSLEARAGSSFGIPAPKPQAAHKSVPSQNVRPLPYTLPDMQARPGMAEHFVRSWRHSK